MRTGLGHLQRSIALALANNTEINLIILAIIDKGLEGLFREIPNTIFFYSDEEVSSYIDYNQCRGTCVIDAIEMAEVAQVSIRKNFNKTISISPVFNNYDVIDYLFTRFKGHVYPSHIRIFEGLEYAIFNPGCIRVSDDVFRQNLTQKELSIGISMGGTDAPNKTLKILKTIIRLKQNCTFWVLLGEGYSYSYQELVDVIKCDSRHEIILAKSNSSMWKILSNCSVLILAGGLTTIESIYAGIPSINIFEKEFQKAMISRELLEKNVSINLGLFNEKNLEKLVFQLEVLNSDRNILLQMRKNSYGLLDKSGPERTLRKIVEIAEL